MGSSTGKTYAKIAPPNTRRPLRPTIVAISAESLSAPHTGAGAAPTKIEAACASHHQIIGAGLARRVRPMASLAYAHTLAKSVTTFTMEPPSAHVWTYALNVPLRASKISKSPLLEVHEEIWAIFSRPLARGAERRSSKHPLYSEVQVYNSGSASARVRKTGVVAPQLVPQRSACFTHTWRSGPDNSEVMYPRHSAQLCILSRHVGQYPSPG